MKRVRRRTASPVGADTAHAPSMDEMLERMWPIMPSTVVMRRAAFDRAGGFSPSFGQDLDFWPRIREQGSFIYLPDRLVRFTFGPLYPKVLDRDGPKEFVRSDSCPLRRACRRTGEGFHPASCTDDRQRRRRRDEQGQHGSRAAMFHPSAQVRSAACEELHANSENVLARPDPPRTRRKSVPRRRHSFLKLPRPCFPVPLPVREGVRG